MPITSRVVAESVGTFWLVFGGIGTAVYAAAFPDVGVGLLGVSLAFGLTVVTMAYSIGHISGSHLNPAVTVGLWAGRRFPGRDVVPYVLGQVAGAIVAAALVYGIALGQPGFDLAASGLGANGYGEHSPGGYSLVSALVAEVVLTFMFVVIVMGATHSKAPAGFAPLAIGLGLTLIHLVSIPITNTSVNPARSTGPALVVGGRLGHRAVVALLACATPGRRAGRYRLPCAVPRPAGEARCHRGRPARYLNCRSTCLVQTGADRSVPRFRRAEPRPRRAVA